MKDRLSCMLMILRSMIDRTPSNIGSADVGTSFVCCDRTSGFAWTASEFGSKMAGKGYSYADDYDDKWYEQDDDYHEDYDDEDDPELAEAVKAAEAKKAAAKLVVKVIYY